jgi:hypothetical protein
MSYALSFAYSVLYFLIVLDLTVSFIPAFCFALMASQDDPLAVKMAEGMRSTSARGVFFGLPFLHEQKT